MVDKKACRVKKRKYKVNGVIFVTRMSLLLVLVAVGITLFNNLNKDVTGTILETSSYIDENGYSSMVYGVKDGAVYTSSVTPIVTSSVEKAILTRNGKQIKFKSGKKISKVGSYILSLEDSNKNVDTVYFDIEY